MVFWDTNSEQSQQIIERGKNGVLDRLPFGRLCITVLQIVFTVESVLKGDTCAEEDILSPFCLFLMDSEEKVMAVNQASPDLHAVAFEEFLNLRSTPRAVQRYVERPRPGAEGIAVGDTL